MSSADRVVDSKRLRCGTVLRVREEVCEVVREGRVRSVRYAGLFPSPRTERVSPGHLVAFATAPDGTEAVVWRWYDAVVLGAENGQIRLWEPAHGEVLARPRPSYEQTQPGERAYASAGLPGADWWVCTRADSDDAETKVELDEVRRLYTDNNLWSNVFAAPA